MPSLLCCQYIWAVSLYLFSQFLVSTIYSLLWTAVKSLHFIFLSTCPFFIHFLIITIIGRGKIYLLPTTLKTMSPFGAKFGQVFQQTPYKRLGFPTPWVSQLWCRPAACTASIQAALHCPHRVWGTGELKWAWDSCCFASDPGVSGFL